MKIFHGESKAKHHGSTFQEVFKSGLKSDSELQQAKHTIRK